MKSLIVALLLVLFLLIFLVGFVRMVLRLGRRHQRPQPPQIPRCSCGYLLEGLELPRCPECGRLFGFTCTMEELGLSEAELRELTERRKKDKNNCNFLQGG